MVVVVVAVVPEVLELVEPVVDVDDDEELPQAASDTAPPARAAAAKELFQVRRGVVMVCTRRFIGGSVRCAPSGRTCGCRLPVIGATSPSCVSEVRRV